MSKKLQNVVLLMEPTHSSVPSMKGGNMCVNRFCIDEDVAFELSGVYYLKQWSHKVLYYKEWFLKDNSFLHEKYRIQRILKGKALYY